MSKRKPDDQTAADQASSPRKARNVTVLGDSESSSGYSSESSEEELFGSPTKPKKENKENEEKELEDSSEPEDANEPDLKETDLEREKRLFEEDEARRKASELRELELRKSRGKKLNQAIASDSESSESSSSEEDSDEDEDEEYHDGGKKKSTKTKRSSRIRPLKNRKTFQKSKSDEDSEDSDNESDMGKRSSSGRKHLRSGESRTPKIPIDLKDLGVMQLTRSVLLDWADEPFVDQCKNGFVRLNIGTASDGTVKYRVCRIVDLVHTEPYVVDGAFVDFDLDLDHAGSRKKWSVSHVSNDGFSAAEFQQWTESMQQSRIALPTKRMLEDFVARIKREVHDYQYTDIDVKRKIERKKSMKKMPTNFASEKLNLMHELEQARSAEDTEKVADIESKLEELGELQHSILVAKEAHFAKSNAINVRNIEENRRAQFSNRDAGGEITWNPFARRPTRPGNLWATKKEGEESGIEATNSGSKAEGPKPNQNSSSLTSASGFLKTSLASKMGKHNETKALPDDMDVLGDFELDKAPSLKNLAKRRKNLTTKSKNGEMRKRMSIEEYRKRMEEAFG